MKNICAFVRYSSFNSQKIFGLHLFEIFSYLLILGDPQKSLNCLVFNNFNTVAKNHKAFCSSDPSALDTFAFRELWATVILQRVNFKELFFHAIN